MESRILAALVLIAGIAVIAAVYSFYAVRRAKAQRLRRRGIKRSSAGRRA